MLPSELGGVAGPVACDTETSGLYPDEGSRVSVVSVAWEKHDGGIEALAWPFDQGVRNKLQQAQLDLDGDENLGQSEWDALLAWLGRQRLVMANAKFDLAHLRVGTRHWPGTELEPCLVWDTMLATRELDPRESAALKATAERWGLCGGDERGTEEALAAFLKKSKLPRRNPGDVRYDLVPWAVIGPYAAKDAELTMRLYLHQLGRLADGEGSMLAIERRVDTMRTLYRMERRGVAYDARKSLEATKILRKRREEIARELPFKPTLTGARNYYFGQLGMVPFSDKITGGGKPQLDDEVVARLSAQNAPHAQRWGELVKVDKAISMWYQGYADACGPDGRLRTSFKQNATRSNRMAVERVQLQAVPKEDKALEGVPSVRSLFGAKDGYELWNLDLSQAELRVAAKYAKCGPMLELLAAGEDLHGITTEQIFGISKGHPDWSAKRDIGKRLTFASLFQVGGRTFQATLSKQAGITLGQRECEEIVARWRALYPQFGRMYRRAERIAEARGYVHLLPNTEYQCQSWFGPRDFAHTAWSRIVQSSLAEFLSLWLVAAERWLIELGQPEALLLTVHDSILLELPEGEEGSRVVKEVAERSSELATRIFGFEQYGFRMDIDVKLWTDTLR